MISRLKIKGLPKIVDRAYNGLEAFSKVKESLEARTHVYALVLTDISMPIMDGFEACVQIMRIYDRFNKMVRQDSYQIMEVGLDGDNSLPSSRSGHTIPKIIACTAFVSDEIS